MSASESGSASGLFARSAAWAHLRVSKVAMQLRETGLVIPTAGWLFFRLWASVWAGVAVSVIPPSAAAAKQYYSAAPIIGGLPGLVWGCWQRWDTIWYVKIAEQGYRLDDLSRAFFPLYSILIKGTTPLLGGNGVAAAVCVATAAMLVALILLYRLAEETQSKPAARRTLLYLLIFPTAFFFWAGYTESLFLALAAGMFLAARHRRWGWAGILAGLAGLTRPQGMLLIVPLAVEFWQRERSGPNRMRSFLGLVPAAAGATAYWIYLAMRFENPVEGLQVHYLWRGSALPWESLAAAVSSLLDPRRDMAKWVGLPDLVIVVLFLALLIISWPRLPLSWSMYMAIIILPPLFGVTTSNPYLPLAAMSRYVLVAFPAFIMLGRYVPESWPQRLLVGFSFLLQTLWLMLFAAWVFVG